MGGAAATRRAHVVLCVACALRSAEALRCLSHGGLLSSSRPPLPRGAGPQALLEQLHMLPDAATLLEHMTAPSSLLEHITAVQPSLLEHGPILTVAAHTASGEVAQILKDRSIIQPKPKP